MNSRPRKVCILWLIGFLFRINACNGGENEGDFANDGLTDDDILSDDDDSSSACGC